MLVIARFHPVVYICVIVNCLEDGNGKKDNMDWGGKIIMDIMPVSEVIERVAAICKANGVRRLDLFGSFATGTAAPTSDIDFVVYGCGNIQRLEEEVLEIDTQRKIDLFHYEEIKNEFLLEDIRRYGKQIY